MQKNLNICQYTPVRICDECGINARFNLLFQEVCALKSLPFNLPIASSTVLGGIKIGLGLSINSSTGVLSVTNNTGKIIITSNDFELDGITYLNSNLTNPFIFLNSLNRFLRVEDGEFIFIPGGIQILLPGFDATQFNYTLHIIY